MSSSDILGRRYLRGQALFTAAAFLGAAVFFRLAANIPFDRRLGPLLAVSSVVYFVFSAAAGRPGADLRRWITGLSLFGALVMGFVLHMTGGIASPLVCFYFALLISEVGYGVASTASIFACVLSYLFVVLGEASGLLPAGSAWAAAIYSNRLVVWFIVAAVVSYMALTGYIGKVVLNALRKDFREKEEEAGALLARFSGLQADSHIGMLAHRIAHDLKGPLGAISGYAQVLRARYAGSEDEIEMLDEMIEIADSMSDSLKNISRFGRAADAEKERVPVLDFMSNLLAVVAFAPEAGGVSLVKDFSVPRGTCVMACRRELQQAYFNILINSLEAAAAGPAERKVVVSLRVSDGRLEADFLNSGPPVPQRVLDALFRKPVTGKAGGTGVGMLITRDLLRRNGAVIGIANVHGGGVRVSTTHPLCAGAAGRA